MKISIKTLKRELFQVDTEGCNLVSDLKAKIEELRADLPADRQKLIHSGKVLKDEQPVSELGIAETDFIVCMILKEKKPTPVAPAPVAAPAPAAAAAVDAPTTPAAAPAAPTESPFVTAEGLAALTGMGFPEAESRAALAAAMGNADLAYEFLLTGIPTAATPPPAVAGGAGGAVSIDALRRHPQFNMLKQLVQANPAALSQVLDLIGQQSPELLAAIHANNDAFIAMMNEPIVDAPAPAPEMPTGMPGMPPMPNMAALGGMGGPGGPMGGPGGPMTDPAAMMQMLAAMPAPQRAMFAQQLGIAPEQLDNLMQMMAAIPPEQMGSMMGAMGAMGARGPGAPGGAGAPDQPGVIRLTEAEMASVNRLVALGFTQQQAAQAYLACDKNETLAANLLFDGGMGWGDDEGGEGGDGDDNMYN